MMEILNRAILNYMREATMVALSGQKSMRVSRKRDESYVTDIDLELSRRAKATFGPIVSPDSVITEEDCVTLETLNSTPSSAISDRFGPYLVVVDPIDGTRNFVQGLPLYGVSVGVLRDLKPWIGGIAFPALDEMVYCDGKSSYFVKGIFDGKAIALTKPATPFGSGSLLLANEDFYRTHRWDYAECTSVISLGCSVVELAWPALGRGDGTIFGARLWDLTGAWAILSCLGMELYRIGSLVPVRVYDPADFDPHTNLLNEYVVSCRPENAERITASITVV